MRLYTFEHNGAQRIGAEQDGRLVDLVAASSGALPGDMLNFIRGGAAARQAADAALAFAAARDRRQSLSYALDQVQLLAPLLNPGKILCSGVNYIGHLTENPGATLPETPGCFSKLPSAIIGPGAPI